MKYVIIEMEDNPLAEDFLDNMINNMYYYFNLYCHFDHKVWNKMSWNNANTTPLTIPIYYGETSVTKSDEKNKNSKLYDRFISRLFEQAHNRLNLKYSDHLPINCKKATIYVHSSKLIEINLNYKSKHMNVKIEFKNKSPLTFEYMIVQPNGDEKKITVLINKNNKILSTKIQENNNTIEKEINTFDDKQLDYLNALLYYSSNDDELEKIDDYINNIFEKDYKKLLDYFTIRTMVQI